MPHRVRVVVEKFSQLADTPLDPLDFELEVEHRFQHQIISYLAFDCRVLMAGDSSPDYKTLFLREAELRRQAEDRQKQAEDRQRQAEERIRPTTFKEYIRACHNLLSRPVVVQDRSRSTKGSINRPKGKYCPTHLRLWVDCPARQQEVYNSVCNYFGSAADEAPRLFSSLSALEDLGRRLCRRPLSSERDLESYERSSVEDHVHDVIAELCKIPDAQNEFALGDGIQFENHANTFDEDDSDTLDVGYQLRHRLSPQRSVPDQFCVHRKDGNTNTLVTTVEYKPPHKLTVENLRAGLRPMDFMKEVVLVETIPTDPAGKLRHNAEQLTGAVLAQEYHVMINEGLEYSYVTNGLALVLLQVRYDDPSTLYYYLCEPIMEVSLRDDQSMRLPLTAIARVLCLCLMSSTVPIRTQEWRNAAMRDLHVWEMDLDYARSQIPDEERNQTPPGSEYLPSSSPGPAEHHQIHTRSQTRCAPLGPVHHSESSDSSDSDSVQAAPRHKRDISQVASSPPTHRSSRHRDPPKVPRGQGHHTAEFCTQRCLLGLCQNGMLDRHCPNVELHRKGQDGNRHLISTERLVQLLKQQLDENLDRNCAPFAACGGYAAPFKITCISYGYTIVGKGTTSQHWNEVSREAEVYKVLQKAQGSAVPVFLGTIDLAKIYFLHGAGKIRHMLLMAWAGTETTKLEHSPTLLHEIARSKKEIRSLGVVHGDFRFENILWNAELGRALIIDFHRSKLDPGGMKRSSCGKQGSAVKRLRVA